VLALTSTKRNIGRPGPILRAPLDAAEVNVDDVARARGGEQLKALALREIEHDHVPPEDGRTVIFDQLEYERSPLRVNIAQSEKANSRDVAMA
jgi:hypothetical protein